MKLRSTRQKEVLEEVCKSFKSFFTADELLAKAQKKEEGISRATAYRFLKEANLHTYQCEGKSIYSVENRSHCHFICEKTGKVIHFDIDNIDFLKKKIPGDINSFQIEVRGVCKDCD